MRIKQWTIILNGSLLLAACAGSGDYPRMQDGTPISQLSGPMIVSGHGVVQSIDLVSRESLDKDAGKSAGAVLAEALGRPVGQERAPDKNMRQGSQVYRVSLRMDDDTVHRFALPAQPAFQVGDRVKVANGAIVEH